MAIIILLSCDVCPFFDVEEWDSILMGINLQDSC
jgi:hypothetical protein